MKRKSKGSKKKPFKIVVIFLVIVLLLGAVGYYLYLDYQKKIDANKLHVILKKNLTAEINSEVKNKDFIDKVENGTLLNGDIVLDTKKLGKKNVEFIFKNKDDEEEKRTYQINIVDRTKPIIEAGKEINSYIGSDVDLLKDVKVTDNSLEEIVAKVVGEYDKNKAGNYNLKYEAVDSSGNIAEFDFILNIISDPNNRTFTTSKGFLGKVIDGVTYIDGVLIANKSYSLPSNFGTGITGEVQEAFNRLSADARGLGYNLTLASGFRSYWTQQSLYNNYVARDGKAAADRYSARPGHSEHQTGLAFDTCEHTRPDACINSAFHNTEQAKWLSENCYKYGLILRYPQGKEEITGYMYESWHLRYVGVELATKLYNGGNWITLEEYYGIDSKYSY